MRPLERGGHAHEAHAACARRSCGRVYGRVVAAPSCRRSVPLAGTGSPQTGDFTPSGNSAATPTRIPRPGDGEEAPDAVRGNIIDRSLSDGAGHGASVNSGKKAKSNPTFNASFEGLNLYQQRYARGGNQFSVEPPDQALCVGNGYVRRGRQRRAQRLQHVGTVGPAGQHRDQHRRRLPAERQPRRRPELVLRLPAGDQPHDGRPRPVRHRPDAASTTRRRSGSSSSC